MYASLAFLHCLTLFQFISRNLKLPKKCPNTELFLVRIWTLFAQCLTLFQFISRNLNLNFLIDLSENLRLYTNPCLASSFRQYIYENRKLENDQRCQFYNPWFIPSVHYRACDDMINRAGNLSGNTHGFIYSWNHPYIKYKI